MSAESAVPSFPAYLLAGGRSRRFGSDKARATLDGTPLVLRLARRLRPVAPSIHVIADRPGRYADLGLTTLGDVEPGLGPLGGLATALAHADAPWIWVCSCDLLDLRPHWLERLDAARGEAGGAVAFREAGGADAGRWHPFPALYRRNAEDEVRRRIAAGRLEMQGFLDEIATPVGLPDDWPDPVQANTPADLEAFRRGGRSEGG